MQGKKAVYCGDIGCYTLGNVKPLDMVDTCLCMGADVTIAQGLHMAEPETTCFSFIGDSTFFHSGISGVVNAVYNQSSIVLVVLDNGTTAMTGHQPHPGIGRNAAGGPAPKVSIEKLLEAIGVSVWKADPLDQASAVDAVRKAAEAPGVRAVLFASPCAALARDTTPNTVDTARCAGCGLCVGELGCPAMRMDEGKALIETSQCVGCGLCASLCPVGCIGIEGEGVAL